LTLGAVGDHREHPTKQAGRVYTENDWNPYTLEELEKMSAEGGEGYVTALAMRDTDADDSNPSFPAQALYYMGAKKYAELEAWDIQKRTGAKWSLATMQCTMIFGPPSE
jgi:hypothetical protein